MAVSLASAGKRSKSNSLLRGKHGFFNLQLHTSSGVPFSPMLHWHIVASGVEIHLIGISTHNYHLVLGISATFLSHQKSETGTDQISSSFKGSLKFGGRRCLLKKSVMSLALKKNNSFDTYLSAQSLPFKQPNIPYMYMHMYIAFL